MHALIDTALPAARGEALVQSKLNPFHLLRRASDAVTRASAVLPADIALLMTFLVLLLYGPKDWYVRIPLILMTSAGILVPRVRHSRTLWFLVTAVLSTALVLNWFSYDNHKFLFCYWCLAITIAVHVGDTGQQGKAARLLIALAFGFAVVWKVVTPEFMNGVMFQHVLLFDDRFAVVSQLVGELSPLDLRVNRDAMATLTEWASDASEAKVQSSADIVATANFMIWWTLVIEGLIAVAFLLPRSSKLAFIGDAALLVFIATTYPIAPVLGFGAVLLTMGFSQAPGAWTRLAYLAGFILLHAFRAPWAQFVVGST